MNAVTEASLAEGAHLDHSTLQREGPGTLHIGNLRVVQAGGSQLPDPSLLLRRGAREERALGPPRRRGGGNGAERPRLRLGLPARRQPHPHRPRAAARDERGVLQGDPRRLGTRRLRRADRRPAERAGDRRAPDEPQSHPLGHGEGRLQAAARDLQQRREVLARLDDGAPRRDDALLPPLARPRRGRGAVAPHLRVRKRDGGEGRGRATSAPISRPRSSRGSRTRTRLRRAHERRRGPPRAASRGSTWEDPGRLPDPRDPLARQAPRLPRQREHDAEAGRA